MILQHCRIPLNELKKFFKPIDDGVLITKEKTGWCVELDTMNGLDVEDGGGLMARVKAIRSFLVANKPGRIDWEVAMPGEEPRVEYVGPAPEVHKLEYRMLGIEYKAIRERRRALKEIINGNAPAGTKRQPPGKKPAAAKPAAPAARAKPAAAKPAAAKPAAAKPAAAKPAAAKPAARTAKPAPSSALAAAQEALAKLKRK